MKSKWLFIAFVFSNFTSAMAADVSLPYKAAPTAPAAFSWTGCYVGGNGGGGRGSNAWDQPALTAIGASFEPVRPSGWFAGVQGGCDYQTGSLVFGIEAQYDWADIRDTETLIPLAGAVAFSQTSKLDRFATATARIGYSFDRVLVYGKGGAAFAHFNNRFEQNDLAGTVISFAGSQNIAGFVVGAGFEYALLPNLSFKAEYNYFDFGRNGTSLACASAQCAGGPTSFPFQISQNMQTAMLGINYRFGLGSLWHN